MAAITLSVEIKEDRHLEIDLPPETPLDVADLTIQPHVAPASGPTTNPAREVVIRLILGSIRLIASDMRVEVKEVNSVPSVLYWQNGKLTSVFNFAIANGHVVAIHSVFNPDKLAYLEQHGGL